MLRLILIAGLIFGIAVSAMAVPIASIDVEGNQNIDELYIITISGLKVGDEYNLKDIQNAIRKLYRRGQFRDIRVDAKSDQEGIHLHFLVEEYPILGKIELVGNRKIGRGELHGKFTLLRGQPLSPTSLHQIRRDILDLYQEKGYLLAEVEFETSPPNEANHVSLKLKISEGRKVKIRAIRFENNNSFSDNKLAKQFENTKESRWFRSAHFNEMEFEADLDLLENFYREKGYLDAQIIDHNITYEKNGKYMNITIEVDEGVRYYFGNVDWDGNELYTNSQLQNAMQYKTGDVYNQKLFEETIQKYYELYSDKGHIFANIIPDETIEDRVVHLTYRIVEGEPARIRKVMIAGNTKTHEKVIRREIDVFPGELFDRSKVIRSQRDILYLNFFDETQFQFDIKPVEVAGPGATESEIDLLFNVAEKRTGTIGAGAGYSSQDKVTGFVELSESNLLGRAQRVNLRWQFGKTRQDIEFGFTEPWLLNTPTAAGFDIFRTSRDYGDYDRITTGFALRAGRPFPWLDYTSVYGRYQLEDVEIKVEDGYEPIEGGYDLRDAEGKRRSISFRLSLARDSRDDNYQPTRGSRTALSAEYAGGDVLGGDVKYQKYSFDTEWYFLSLWKWSLGVGSQIGYVTGLDDASEVPIYERFELGGVVGNRLRGYPDYSIVPEGNDYREGGRVMSIISAESRFTVAPSQLYLVLFAEAGNTWNHLVEADLGELKRSVGFGIRVITPMGPLGFDYAYGFDRYWDGSRYQSGKSWEPHFIFGAAF